MKAEKIPDVILVKKVYPNKGKRKKERRWKLKKIAERSNSISTNDDGDYNDFLEDLEEDEELRKKVNIYADKKKMGNNAGVSGDDGMDVDGGASGDRSEYPQISIEEMLDDLTLE